MNEWRLSPTPVTRRSKTNGWMPAAIALIGVALMIFKISADSEPGAISILLVLAGGGWYAFLKDRNRSDRP